MTHLLPRVYLRTKNEMIMVNIMEVIVWTHRQTDGQMDGCICPGEWTDRWTDRRGETNLYPPNNNVVQGVWSYCNLASNHINNTDIQMKIPPQFSWFSPAFLLTPQHGRHYWCHSVPEVQAHLTCALRPEQGGWHIADNIFKCNCILIKISLKFIPQG